MMIEPLAAQLILMREVILFPDYGRKLASSILVYRYIYVLVPALPRICTPDPVHILAPLAFPSTPLAQLHSSSPH